MCNTQEETMVIIRENTIKKLENNYKDSRQIWNDFISNIKGKDKKLFCKFFHLRPTTNLIDIVCTYRGKLAMRVSQCKLSELKKGLERAFEMYRNFDEVVKMPKSEIFNRYGFKVYETNTYKEYNIQADFITYMQENGYELLASEFNIASGSGTVYEEKNQRGEQRIDILALKENTIWIIEVKGNDDKTDVVSQVKRYKNNIITPYIDIVKKLLCNASNCQLDQLVNYSVKTAIVHLIGDGNYDVDAVWRVENFIKTK